MLVKYPSLKGVGIFSQVLLVSMLQACGGGGGGSTTAASPASSANTAASATASAAANAARLRHNGTNGGGLGRHDGHGYGGWVSGSGGSTSGGTGSTGGSTGSTGGTTGSTGGSTGSTGGTTGSTGGTTGSTGGTTGSTGGTTGSTTPSTTLSIKVSGNRFVDANGAAINLQGVNVSGLEFVAVGGWSAASPWGGQTGTATPDWTAIQTWGVNIVRIPLNESSWLGTSCLDAGGFRGTAGVMINPDPGANYKATVAATVASATAAGLYVILDLHWTAPGNNCAVAQNPMADMDNSINFWTQVASIYKANPNVMFEAFNEPYVYAITSTESAWPVLQNGGTMTQFQASGTVGMITVNWQSAGMQQIVNAIRGTGATNVVLISGQNYTSDLSSWLQYKPSDPLNQIAATWHAYPTYGAAFGTASYALPNYGQQAYTNASTIMAANIPVLITEFGDQDSAGTPNAPFASALLPWADKNNMGYLGWTWDVWQNPSFVLIKDAAGTPTDGYGVYVKAHYLCRKGGGGTSCS